MFGLTPDGHGAAVGAGAVDVAGDGRVGLLLGEVADGHPAGLAVEDDLDALGRLAAGDQDLLAGLEHADLLGLLAGRGPDVEVDGGPQLGVGACGSALRDGGLRHVDAELRAARWVASTREAEREITTSLSVGGRRLGGVADSSTALLATRLSRTSGLVARTPRPTVDSGRQDGDRAGHDMGLGQTAGIGFPLVAMVCHSADPLLVAVRGNARVACGERDASND